MVQARSRIGILTDGDTWFVLIADISASSPEHDVIRVARFSEVHGDSLFAGNPYAILLACLHMWTKWGYHFGRLCQKGRLHPSRLPSKRLAKSRSCADRRHQSLDRHTGIRALRIFAAGAMPST